MSNTIFHGVAVLPRRFADYKGSNMEQGTVEHQLMMEIRNRHRSEILSRPHVKTWSLAIDTDTSEYFIKIYTAKPLDQIDPNDLVKLQSPVGGFNTKLEYVSSAVGQTVK